MGMMKPPAMSLLDIHPTRIPKDDVAKVEDMRIAVKGTPTLEEEET